MRKSFDELLSIFTHLGARNPEGWARSEIDRDIPQLARFVFIRQAWTNCVIEDGDVSWIDETRQQSKKTPEAPGAGVGQALERLLARGASPEDIAEVVRGMQYRTLFGLCYQLADPGPLEQEIEDVHWTLCETDEEGQPLRAIDALHEDVLKMDPTGREMRPRKTGPS